MLLGVPFFHHFVVLHVSVGPCHFGVVMVARDTCCHVFVCFWHSAQRFLLHEGGHATERHVQHQPLPVEFVAKAGAHAAGDNFFAICLVVVGVSFHALARGAKLLVAFLQPACDATTVIALPQKLQETHVIVSPFAVLVKGYLFGHWVCVWNWYFKASFSTAGSCYMPGVQHLSEQLQHHFWYCWFVSSQDGGCY